MYVFPKENMTDFKILLDFNRRVLTNLVYRGNIINFMIFLINTCNKSHFTDIIVYAICAVYFEIFIFLLKLPNCDNFIRVTKILIFNKKKNPIVILYAIKIFCTMKHIADLFFLQNAVIQIFSNRSLLRTN